MMVDKRGVFCVPAFPVEEPHDPTGAGDSLAGGFMGYPGGCGDKADASLRRAMVYGSVLGELLRVEKFGLTAAAPEAQRDTRQGTPFCKTDAIQIVNR